MAIVTFFDPQDLQTAQNLKEKIKMVETTAFIKVFYNFIVIFISSMLVYLDLEKEPMFFFAILLVIDYITGLYKAKILGHSITSNKMKYGCISKLLLLLIPIVLAIGAKSVGADMNKVLLVGLNSYYSTVSNSYATVSVNGNNRVGGLVGDNNNSTISNSYA